MKHLFALLLSVTLVALSIFLFRHKSIDFGKGHFEKGRKLHSLSSDGCTYDSKIIKEAIVEFEKGISKGYTEREIFDELVSCYWHLHDDLQDLEIIYSRALKYYPDDYEFIYLRGECRKELKNFKGALEDFSKAGAMMNARFRNNYFEVIYKRGEMKYALGDTNNAELDRKLAINILRESGRSDSLKPYY